MGCVRHCRHQITDSRQDFQQYKYYFMRFEYNIVVHYSLHNIIYNSILYHIIKDGVPEISYIHMDDEFSDSYVLILKWRKIAETPDLTYF